MIVWFQKFRVKSSYAEINVKDDYGSATIDVVADVRTERVVVLGGNGFVGSAICKSAVSKGIEVTSLSRSGRSAYEGPWVDQVNWQTVAERSRRLSLSLFSRFGPSLAGKEATHGS
ncbi:NAD(P)-binding Rossmann-fold superfamily protein [Euphorbia peplus]|nr:NAD(P)-binding Rossmann-fold superfamily protein [Euphorbia peplus]